MLNNNPSKYSTDSISDSLEKAYHGMLLNEDTKENIRSFLYYRMHESVLKTKVPYNILIRCNDSSRMELFAQKLLNALKSTGIEKKAFCIMTEKELLSAQSSILKLSEKYSVLVLTSFAQESTPAWTRIQKEMESTPEMVKIICATDEVAEKRFRSDEHFYYRVLGHHIFLKELNSSEICSLFLQKLSGTNYDITQEFKEGISHYISVVYPKADLRNEAFVDDLFNRVISHLLSSFENPDLITADCIPYYRKPRQYEDIVKEISEITGLDEVKKNLLRTGNILRYQKELKIQIPETLNKIFIGNAHIGKFEIASLYSELLFSLGQLHTEKIVRISADHLEQSASESTLEEFRRFCQKADGKLIYIDHADCLFQEHVSPFTEILCDTISSHATTVLVLASTADSFEEKLNHSLLSKYNFEITHFHNLTSKQWTDNFVSYCESKNCRLDEFGQAMVEHIIADLQKSQKFKNWATVKELFNQAIRTYASTHIADTDTQIILTEKDFPYDFINSSDSGNWIKDDYVSKSPSEKSTTNILLTAMSTFPKEIKKSIFSYKGQTYIGRYQLDPIPKMLSYELAKSGRCLDKILMLCTPKTTEKKMVRTDENQTIEDSPIGYFKYQIEDYMNPEIELKERFSQIDIDENKPAEGIHKTVEIIRNIRKRNEKAGKTVHLYLDTHGGFRGVQLMLEAIISLLKNEDIHIEKIYAIQFSDSKDQPNRIIDNDAELEMFDFVSGINEFINYGRINSLSSHMKTQDSNLLKPIQKIADSIQLCDIPKFEEGLNDLAKYFDCQGKIKNPYLNLFEENIKNDYRSLLTKNRTVTDEIEWCLRKGFYQQAITLIESRMPEEIFKSKLLTYNNSLDTFATQNCGHYNKYVFILNRCDMFWSRQSTDKERREEKISIMQISDISSFIQNVSDNNLKRLHSLKFYCPKTKDRAAFSSPITIRSKNKKMLYVFLWLHSGFQQLRHNYNHAGNTPNGISVVQISQSIKNYVHLANELLIHPGRESKTP